MSAAVSVHPGAARPGTSEQAESVRVAALEATLERVRARLTTTTLEERELRTGLVLGHEVVRMRLEVARAAGSTVIAAPGNGLSRRPFARDDYDALVERMRVTLEASVPAGASLLVVSRGDDRLLFDRWDAAHFPQGPGGVYAGFYPADSAAAIEHLETLRAQGAEFVAFPATASWWLEYYDGLAGHLLTTARAVAHEDDCLVFDLRRTPDGPSDT